MHVTIVGPLDDATGYAEITREIALAFFRLGARVHARPVAWGVPTPDLLPEVRYLLNSFRATRPAGGPVLSIGIPPLFAREPGAPAVGLTMLECDRLPAQWVEACRGTDEVWVPSTFNAHTFVGSGVPHDKVRVFPLGVDTSRFRPGVFPLSLPGKRGFVFLSVFEWTPRKGWDLLLRAFARAFSARDDVCLVLRTHSNGPDYDASGETIGERVRYLLRELRPDPAPVLVLPGVMPQDQVPSLYAAADCLVLPTRGEGWNLPALEALACGIPVITTRWSGHLDYLNDENAYLVEIEGLEPAAWPGHPAGEVYRGARWARPSVEHLAHLMRRVYEHPDEARARAERGRKEVALRFSWDRCAASMLERLRELDARPYRAGPPGTGTQSPRALWGRWLWTPHPARPAEPAPATVQALSAGSGRGEGADREDAPGPGGPGRVAAPRDVPDVLLVVPSWGDICGVAEYSRSLAAGLQGLGCRVRVAGNGDLSPERIVELAAGNAVVHIQYEYSLFDLEVMRVILARLRAGGTPLVLTMHSYTDEAVKHNAVIRPVRPVVVHAQHTRQKLVSSGWKPAGLHVIPMGARRFPLPARSSVAAGLGLGRGPHVGFCGLMHWHKGLLALVAAVNQLRTAYPGIRCHVFTPVGTSVASRAYLEHFCHECTSRGLQDALALHVGFEPEEQLVAKLHAMDVNVLPYEDCGYWSTSAAVRLAMAARRPVIVTDVPFFRDLQDEVVRIPDASPEAIADAIVFVLSHPTVAAATVAAAERYLEEHSWEASARLHLELYRMMLENGGHRG